MTLGNFIAKIIIDVSGVGSNLTKAEKSYDEYCTYIEVRDKQMHEARQMVFEKTNAKQVSSIGELGKKERAELEKQAREYVSFCDKKEKAEEALAKKQETIRRKQLADSQKDFDKQQALIEKRQSELSALKQNLLQWASIAITVPIIIGTKKALQDFMEFQQELQNVKAVTGATASDMQKLSDMALDMSTNLRFSAKEIASAYLELGQAGYEANEIMQATQSIMGLAAAGMRDIAFTSELVVTTLKAFGMEASEAGRVADVFASSNAKSVSSLDKISASLKYTSGLWASQGWEIENLIGVLNILYDTGVRGEKAGRMLASAIRSLIKPTSGATAEIKRLFGSLEALSPTTNSIENIISKLKDVGATQTSITKIFGKESAEIITRLLTNAELIQGSIEGVTDQYGEAARQAAIQNESLQSQSKILTNSIQNVALSVGEFLEPALTSIAKAFSSFFESFGKLPSFIQTFLVLGTTLTALTPAITLLIGKFTALTVAMKASAIAGTGLKAVLSTINPVLAVITATIAAGTVAYSAYAKSQQEWANSMNDSMTSLTKQGKNIDDMVSSVNKLYGAMGDTDDVKEKLLELAEIFPSLKRQIEQDGEDSYKAIQKLNAEYAKLKKLQSNQATDAIAFSSNADTKELNEYIAKLADVDSKLAHLNIKMSKTEESDKMIKMANDIGIAVTSIDELKEALGEMEESVNIFDVISDKTEKTGKYFDSETAGMIQRLKTLVTEARSAESQIKRMNFKIGFEDKSSIADFGGGLSTVLAQASAGFDELRSKSQSLLVDADIKGAMKTTDEETKKYIEKSKKEIGDAAEDIFKKILETNSDALYQSGVIDVDGRLTKFFKDYMATVQQEFDRVSKENPLDATTIFSKFTPKIADIRKIEEAESKIKSLNADLTHLERQPSKDYTKIANIKTEIESYKKTVIEAMGALLAFMSLSEQPITTSGIKEQLDWWGQLKQAIADADAIMQGLFVTSLNDKLSELGKKSGSAYEEIKALGISLQKAFENNPELALYGENLDIVDLLLQKVTEDLKNMSIAEGENAGLNLEAQKSLNELNKALSEQSKLTENEKVFVKEYSELSKDLIDSINSRKKAQEELSKATTAEDQASLGLEIENTTKAIEEQEKRLKELEQLYASNGMSIEKVEQTILDMKVAMGLIPSAISNANKSFTDFTNNLKNKQQIEDWKKALKEGSLDIQTFLYLINQIGENNSFTGYWETFSYGLKAIDNVKDELASLNEEYQDLVNKGGTQLEISAKLTEIEEAEELEKALSKSIVDAVGKGLLSVRNLLGSFQRAAEILKDSVSYFGKKSIDNVTGTMNVVDSLGVAIKGIGDATGSTMMQSIGGILSAVAGIYDATIGIINVFRPKVDIDTVLLQNEMMAKFAQIANDAQAQADSIMKDFGNQVGDSLISGVMEQLTDGEMELQIRRQLYQIVAKQVLLLSGFEDMIATESEKMWEALNPGAKQARVLDNQIAQYKQSLSNMTPVSVINAQIDAIDDMIGGLSQTYDSAQIAQLEAQKSVLKGQLDGINQLQTELDRLEAERKGLGEIGLKDNFAEDMANGMQAIVDKAMGVTDGLTDLGDAMGIFKQKASELGNELQRVLAEAVTTGSYQDFRKAVYNKITSAIIDAVVSAGVLKDKVQGIVDSILKMDPTSEEGRMSIKDQINAINNEIRNAYTQAQDLLQPVRDGLASFGEMEINVNPGQVVTALPSDVQNSLVSAIQDVSQNLTQAITEAGLNSYIEVVYITTAYITAMTAQNVQMQSAIFNMGGDIVIGSVQGEGLENWMENFIEQYMRGVAP